MGGPWLVAVMGPTGSGKSRLAEAMADRLQAELVNADAFQVYRGMDVGTNKPVDRGRYALLDLKHPCETFGVGEWVGLAQAILRDAWGRGRSVVVVGGTGLYVRALFEGYTDLQGPPDPALRARLARWEAEEGLGALAAELRRLVPEHGVDERNSVRVRRALERALAPGPRIPVDLPAFRHVKFGLEVEPSALDAALRERVESMRAGGWVDEVRRLLDEKVTVDCPGMRAIGYQSVVRHLERDSDWGATAEEVWSATRQYAKRQRTWLRSEPGLLTLRVEPFGAEGLDRALERAIGHFAG